MMKTSDKKKNRGSQSKSEVTEVKKTIKGPDYPAEQGCPDPDCQTAMGPKSRHEEMERKKRQ